MRSAPARRALRPLVAAAAASLLLAACSSGDPAATPTGGSSAGASGDFPVTITSTFGDTTIESQPERVATVNWGNHDVPIALGVVPVGFAAQTYGDDDGDGVLPWTYEALEGLGATGDDLPTLFDETDGIPMEAVNNVEPDVILGAYSGMTREDFDTLSQIAPTVSYPKYAWGTSWKDMALIDGEAIGKKAQAQDLVDDVLAQIDAALAERPDVAGKTVAYAWFDPSDPSTIGVYTPLDARVQLLADLGLENAPSVVDLAGDTDQFFVNLASEQADTLADADILVTYGDDSMLATLQADPLFSKIPAVARGSVVVLGNTDPISAATSGPTVLSLPWALDDYLDLFQAAAEKVG
ncbi:MAG: iron-siderophore ABC transporter substrate-binding protein [Cellulomonas iranensis]|uniref:iron-siderophore ABC transporter substrate-binding protein n=1 Tax=Cellulomonas iranensis TaxID=76862 RepID=UPI001B02F394|nr:iron-siderophore ABC transporter substrate-binding protein [Cellulomonas iranensis]MBO9567756.1 iron-siderophore ABC transporter substrate-binding protein [Cellulomonas iranensis]